MSNLLKPLQVEIVSRLASSLPTPRLHLSAKGFPVSVLQASQSGVKWEASGGLREQITPVVLQGPGGGVGANLSALHKGSLIITNCLVNHKRYLAINGNNNR